LAMIAHVTAMLSFARARTIDTGLCGRFIRYTRLYTSS
jgi:hypothetical protein